MQGNISVHAANETKSWLDIYDFHMLQWSSRPSDLIVNENVWGQMARQVFAHCR